MANRLFTQFRYALEKMPVDLFLKVAIGAAGAPTIVNGKGVSEVIHNGPGDYTIVLQDTYQRLLMAGMTSIVSTVPASPVMSVKVDDSNDIEEHSVQVILSTSAGTPTDPANGEVLLIQLILSNSTAQ